MSATTTPTTRAEWDAWHDGFHAGYALGLDHGEHAACHHAIADCVWWQRFRAETWRMAAEKHGAAWADYLCGIDRTREREGVKP